MSIRDSHQPTACRICDAALTTCILDYGCTALANGFLKQEELTEPESFYPLSLYLCTNCGQVQLGYSVPADQLFDKYLYLSSTQDFLPAHFSNLADSVNSELREPSFIVEVGSNDGVFLKNLVSTDHKLLGVEPAANVAALAGALGIPTLNAYFDSNTAYSIREAYGPADLIVGANVVAHVSDIRDFMHGVKLLLSPEGTAIFESPYLVDFVEGTLFDTVYHEHVLYLSLKPLVELLSGEGLTIVDAERTTMHGGAIRFRVRHAGLEPASEEVARLLDLEAAMRLDKEEGWRDFAVKVQRIKHDVLSLIEDIGRRGEVIAGYGATAKGNTLCNYFDIGRETIRCIGDRNSLKQGLYTPGKHIPVVAPTAVVEARPDYLFVFAWNIAEEIIRQFEQFRKQGGHFIIPLPDLRVV